MNLVGKMVKFKGSTSARYRPNHSYLIIAETVVGVGPIDSYYKKNGWNYIILLDDGRVYYINEKNIKEIV